MKRKGIHVILLALITTALISSCSVGVNRTETREVSGFNAISINTFGEFIIKQGEEESLTIEGPNNYLRAIDTDVDGKTLYIDTSRGLFGGTVQKITYRITVKDLNEISLSGAGSIKIDELETTDFEVVLTGAGSVKINDLTADSLLAQLTSAGSIEIDGVVKSQDVSLSGVGSYDASELKSEIGSISLTGAGSAEMWVTEKLDINISGVGSVTYYGEPEVTQNITGLGSVNNKGLHP